MAQIQITDLNPSDAELIDELTPEQMLEINGGINWYIVVHAITAFLASIEFLDSIGSPIT
jgi:hypothetical protein